jgi:uncharacterized protein (TIGR03435 family)
MFDLLANGRIQQLRPVPARVLHHMGARLLVCQFLPRGSGVGLVLLKLPAAAVALAVIVAGGTATAQRAFEVASIRPGDPKAPSRPSSRETPSQLDWVSATPVDLLLRAFGVQRFQIVDVPSWTRTERYDIRAVLPSGVSTQHMPEMLRALLAERFALKVRREMRPTPVYELRVSSSGLKMAEVPLRNDLKKPYVGAPEVPVFFDRTSGLPGDEQREIADRDRYHVINAETSYSYRTLEGRVRDFDATRVRISQLRGWLAGVLDRPVVDSTGLTGLYQFKIVLPPAPLNVAVLGPQAPQVPTGVSVFREVQRLGLELERTDAPLEFIVVERLDKPTAN